jgi:hypothetical protein
LTTLLAASWPAGRPVLALNQVDAVDAYIRQLRHEIAAAQDASRNVLEIRVYDRPPADAAVAAALLGAADQMLTFAPAILGDLMRDMFDASRSTRKWVRRALGDNDGRCSPGFLTVAGTASGTQHIIRKMGLPPPKIPPRRVGFGLHHIPQYLPAGWYSTYFNSVDADERSAYPRHGRGEWHSSNSPSSSAWPALSPRPSPDRSRRQPLHGSPAST